MIQRIIYPQSGFVRIFVDKVDMVKVIRNNYIERQF